MNNKAAKKGGEEAEGSGGWPHAHFCSAQSSKGVGNSDFSNTGVIESYLFISI